MKLIGALLILGSVILLFSNKPDLNASFFLLALGTSLVLSTILDEKKDLHKEQNYLLKKQNDLAEEQKVQHLRDMLWFSDQNRLLEKQNEILEKLVDNTSSNKTGGEKDAS